MFFSQKRLLMLRSSYGVCGSGGELGIAIETERIASDEGSVPDEGVGRAAALLEGSFAAGVSMVV